MGLEEFGVLFRDLVGPLVVAVEAALVGVTCEWNMSVGHSLVAWSWYGMGVCRGVLAEG